ncbi:MAG: hypothetical protein A3G41_08130 [Elusimicrobia bacterium RIFCSPLOWO2_12_FULL_59_9]|nr:MAG: hypothetical protein A3G41_08130 [Elusimicrobia bacterium RIFCSPLOWO2_12_FULL_59_9]
MSRKKKKLSDAGAPPQGLWRRLWPYALVFSAAFALRWLHILEAGRSYPFFYAFAGDAASYNDWAQRIAAGAWIGGKVFYQDPLYPYGLALIYRFAGYHTFLVRFLQIAMGSLGCVVIYKTAEIYFDRKTALAAGLASAAYGLSIFYEGTLLKDGLSLFLSAAAMVFLAPARREPSQGRWFLSGLCLGLLVLTRGNAVLMIPFLLAWPFWLCGRALRRPALRYGALFLLGALIPMLPSLAHNYLVGKDIVLTTSQAGPNFYIGNRAGASGTYEPLASGRQTPEFEAEDARRIAEFETGTTLKPSEVSRFWFKKTLREISAEPGRWLRLLAQKAWMFADGFEMPDIEDYYLAKRFSAVLRLPLLSYGFMFPLAVLGMLCGFSRFKELFPLYVFVAVNAVSVVMFLFLGRYRLPSVPALIVFAAFGSLLLWERFRARRYGFAAAGAAFLAAAFWLVNRGKNEKIAFYMTTSLANLATHYQSDKQNDKAISILREALQMDPADAQAHFFLANNYLDMKNYAAAVAEYGETLRLDPRHSQAMYLLGAAYFYQGDAKRAREEWGRVLEIFPSHPQARQGLELLKQRRSAQ